MKLPTIPRPILSRRVEMRTELLTDRYSAEPAFSATLVTEGRYDLLKLTAVCLALCGAAALAVKLNDSKKK